MEEVSSANLEVGKRYIIDYQDKAVVREEERIYKQSYCNKRRENGVTNHYCNIDGIEVKFVPKVLKWIGTYVGTDSYDRCLFENVTDNFGNPLEDQKFPCNDRRLYRFYLINRDSVYHKHYGKILNQKTKTNLGDYPENQFLGGKKKKVIRNALDDIIKVLELVIEVLKKNNLKMPSIVYIVYHDG